MSLLTLRAVLITVVAASQLTGCAAGALSGRSSSVDVDLFQHLAADVDSVPLAWEEHWPPTLPVLIDTRTLATSPQHPDSAFITVPDNVARARIAAIQRVGLDTATTPPSSTCQGNLPDVPDTGRQGCPASARVIYAFSDTLQPRPTEPDDAAVRGWVVIVHRTYLRPNGSTIAVGRYIVSRGATGWRTVSRQLVGFAH